MAVTLLYAAFIPGLLHECRPLGGAHVAPAAFQRTEWHAVEQPAGSTTSA
jgi:hypothetical protein